MKTTPHVLKLAHAFLKSDSKDEYPQVTIKKIERCNDVAKLLKMLRLTPSCHRIKRPIYRQLEKILLPQLDQMGYDELADILPQLDSGSLIYHKVDYRISVLIETVDLASPPKWFIKLLSGASRCSAGMMAKLRGVCEEITSGSES